VIQPAVAALLARVYLTRNDNALLYATKVINDSFSLSNNLNDYGRYDDVGYCWLWEGGNHSHMLYLPNLSTPGLTGTLETGRSLAQYMPSRYLIELYDACSDARFDGTFRTVWFANNPTNLPANMSLGDTVLVVSKIPVSAAYRASKPYVIYDSTISTKPTENPKTWLEIPCIV